MTVREVLRVMLTQRLARAGWAIKVCWGSSPRGLVCAAWAAGAPAIWASVRSGRAIWALPCVDQSYFRPREKRQWDDGLEERRAVMDLAGSGLVEIGRAHV